MKVIENIPHTKSFHFDRSLRLNSESYKYEYGGKHQKMTDLLSSIRMHMGVFVSILEDLEEEEEDE